MLCAAVNVSGDATVSSIVAKSEGKLDVSIFNDPEAGVHDTEDLHIDENEEAELAALVEKTRANKPQAASVLESESAV